MNEQLLKFIELFLMDGVVTFQERQVIFRKSKELGVPNDECEIILEGMILKFNKENNVSSRPIIDKKVLDNSDEKIVITNLPESNIGIDLLYKIYNSEKDKRLPLIEDDLIRLREKEQELLLECDKCDLELQKLFQTKKDFKEDMSSVEIESVDRKIFRNDKELRRIKKEMDLLTQQIGELEKHKEKVEEIFNEDNFRLFQLLYEKSPLLYQSPIFDKLLQETSIDNEEQILNLTRLQKFLVDKERNYGSKVKQCFEKVQDGTFYLKDLESLLVKRKTIISLSNSFHLMFDSLSNNRIGVFMKIYLELESMNLFNTHFENEVLKNLNYLGRQLNRLNDTLKRVSREISKTNNYLNLLNNQMYNVKLNLEMTNMKLDSLDYRLWDIGDSIQEGNRNLESSVELLEDIKGGVSMNNLLTGIQSYQLYKINKNTKG